MRAKPAVVLPARGLPTPCRFGRSGHGTSSLSVAIGVCVIGHPQMASDNSGVFTLVLRITAKTLCFTMVVMATSL